VASLLAGLAVPFLQDRFPILTSAAGDAPAAFFRIVITSCLFTPLYVAAVVVLHNSLAPLYLVKGVAQEIIPWHRVSNAFRPAETETDPASSAAI